MYLDILHWIYSISQATSQLDLQWTLGQTVHLINLSWWSCLEEWTTKISTGLVSLFINLSPFLSISKFTLLDDSTSTARTVPPVSESRRPLLVSPQYRERKILQFLKSLCGKSPHVQGVFSPHVHAYHQQFSGKLQATRSRRSMVLGTSW